MIAGRLFVRPGAVVVLGLSMVYAAFGQVPLVVALFSGVQAAVIAVVIDPLVRVSKPALKSRAAFAIAFAACAGLSFQKLPYPQVVLAAGVRGFIRTPAARRTLPPPPLRRRLPAR